MRAIKMNNKRTIKIIIAAFVFLTAFQNLYGGLSLLIDESYPYVISIGGCHDLLDTGTPLTRSYSGVFAEKEKAELMISHKNIMEGVNLEHLILGLEKNFLPGIRFAAYGKYLGVSDFSRFDVRGLQSGKIGVYDFYIGVPVIFDSASLNLLPYKTDMIIDEAGNEVAVTNKEIKNPWYYIFNSLNAAVNVNYYQSSVLEETASSVFADINVSGKFKIPYIGQPEKLPSIKEINEKEKELVEDTIANYEDRKEKLREEHLKEAGSNAEPVDLSDLDKALNEEVEQIRDDYKKRRSDIYTVYERRENVFNIINDFDVEITQQYMTNFVDDLEMELFALMGVTKKAIDDNYKNLKTDIVYDLNKNEKEIRSLTKKFMRELATPGFKEKSIELFRHYSKYIKSEFSRSGSIKSKNFSIVSFSRNYTVKSNDTWRDISKTYYDSDKYAFYIQQYNKMVSLQRPEPGTTINLPNLDYMKNLEEAERREDEEARKRGYRIYNIRSNDSWQSIAMQFYSTRSRAALIADYNGLSLTNELNTDMELRIPVYAAQAAHERKQREFEEQKKQIIAEIDNVKSETPITDMEQLYYDALVNAFENRLDLYKRSIRMEQKKEDKVKNLRNRVLDFIDDAADISERSMKELKKIKLKREYSILNAANENDIREAKITYKAQEKVLFQDLLLQVFKMKKQMIEQLESEEKAKYETHKESLESMYERQIEDLEEEYGVYRIEIENAPLSEEEKEKKFDELKEKKEKEEEQLKKDNENKIALAKTRYKRKMEEYDWEEYLTHLIYLATDSTEETLAVGMSFMNLGTPVRYRDSADSEALPASMNFDVNYSFLDIEDHYSIFYMQYGYSRFENHSFGIGLMYRAFNLVEARTGLEFQNKEVIPSAGLGVLFDMGLMNYRLDVSVRYEPIYGAALNFGVNIIF